MSTLTIISHTEHYKTQDGTLVGLGSTVTEINQLLAVFDRIVHVAMLHDAAAPPSAMPYRSNRIRFVALPALGGSKMRDKLAIIWKAPSVLKIIHDTIQKTDYFQFRAPTGIGVFVIPYLVLFSSKKGWFKYAGNWKQEHAPVAYRFQRWLLKKQNRKVTINGAWPNQPSHCLSFENPCLTSEEQMKGQEVIQHKSIGPQGLELCFVGRLEKEKGLDVLIDALLTLDPSEMSKFKIVHIVGDGNNLEHYIKKTQFSDLNFVYHGFLSRIQVHTIYKQSHVIVLPSASEGFPKVVSEAMNYGCLPIVSNISSIDNYIKDGINGFLFYPITSDNLIIQIRKLLCLSNENYSRMINSQEDQLLKFTYSFYNKRVNEDLLID